MSAALEAKSTQGIGCLTLTSIVFEEIVVTEFNPGRFKDATAHN